jgi:hypothetical protein
LHAGFDAHRVLGAFPLELERDPDAERDDAEQHVPEVRVSGDLGGAVPLTFRLLGARLHEPPRDRVERRRMPFVRRDRAHRRDAIVIAAARCERGCEQHSPGDPVRHVPLRAKVPGRCRECYECVRMHAAVSAELAAGYLGEQARRVSGVKLRQGAWDGSFAEEAARVRALLGDDCEALKFLTRERVRCVPRRALRGLFTWASGFSVELRRDVPTASEVLALQAVGRRCVSLLPEGVSPAPHESGLDFLIHDLCHLEKFADPAHHEEQVGFFATLRALGDEAGYLELEALLDATFVEDRERLAADVNGSAVYLFALFKMKLKMAARRRTARLAGVPARVSGPLDVAEQRVFDELAAILYEALGFDGSLRRAAAETSARRDAAEAAAVVAREFARRGRAALEGSATSSSRHTTTESSSRSGAPPRSGADAR